MIETIALTNFLSYGNPTTTLEMRPLNVLVGPNASGKSNFVEALAVLRASPGDLQQIIRKGEGIAEWIWRGGGEPTNRATLDVHLRGPSGAVEGPAVPICYSLIFDSEGGAFTVLDERIDPTQSTLSKHRDPENYPELTAVVDQLRGILIYRNWTFGPDAPIRSSCLLDAPAATLAEDLSNLPARLLVLMKNSETKRQLLERLAELSPGFTDLEVTPEGGRLQLYLVEGGRAVPTSRLSDGTLRYLALLAILLEPGAASVVVIEGLELGLHPDMLPTIRDLLIEASERVQLVVTTHSSQLLDALTYHADSVVVCEHHGTATTLERLVQEDIDSLLQFGGLGALWMSGRLGGTRW